MTYADKTTVPAEKSRAEIERILQRYGADEFMYGWKNGNTVIGFMMENRNIRFILPLPDKHSTEFTETATGKSRTKSAALKKWEQACRQKWRALALVIKAKLEAVESGIAIFEDEFMANIVLPNGGTVSQYMLPQIAKSYENGVMPPMLPNLSE